MTTPPVMTVTDELLAELEEITSRQPCALLSVRSSSMNLIYSELRRLRAEKEELAELASQANVNCKNTAYYLRKYRPDLADICSGWCVAIDTAMATQ